MRYLLKIPVLFVLLAAPLCAACSRDKNASSPTPMALPTAPALQGQDQHGASITLQAPLPGYAVVYFYPKDATPGCTAEACAFRDVWTEYQEEGVQVFGVSSDDVESHRDFAKAERIPFSLIADAKGRWAEHFNVSSTLGFYSRVTFLLSPQGKVVKRYDDVDPGIHAKEILADVQALKSAPSSAAL